MTPKYACGKCGSTALYRDDDDVNQRPYICCKICGNRYPGGPAPVVNPSASLPSAPLRGRGTGERGKTGFDPGSALIQTAPERSRGDIARSSNTIDGNNQKTDQHGGSMMAEKTGNKLTDLNKLLFAQLERLNDDNLKGEGLNAEINRSHAIANVAKQIICNGSLVLQAHKAVTDGSIRGGHQMLGITEE